MADIHKDVKRRFLPTLPRVEPIVKDHTAIIRFKECPRKYFYFIVLGYSPVQDEIYFAWGKAYHKFREVLEIEYGKQLAICDDISKAQENAFAIAAVAGDAVWRERGKDQDSDSKFPWMTRVRLMRGFLFAFEWWKKEKSTKAIEVIATEQPFNVSLGKDVDGVEALTGGRFDQIIRWRSKLWGRDFKTTSKEDAYFSQALKLNDQFMRYTVSQGILHGEQIEGQIIETFFNAKSLKKDPTSGGPRIRPFTVSYTRAEQDQWLEEQLKYWYPAMNRARELDVYAKSEHNCKYCTYQKVCTESSESGIEDVLTTQYKHRPWDFAQITE